MRVATFTIVVADYDEAIDFYTRAIGFELIEDTDLGGGKRWVVVGPRTSHPPDGARVLLARGVGDEQRARIGDQTGGRVGFFLEVEDFAAEHARMTAAGVRFVRPPADEPYGTVAVFEDLYGNRWDLIEPR